MSQLTLHRRFERRLLQLQSANYYCHCSALALHNEFFVVTCKSFDCNRCVILPASSLSPAGCPGHREMQNCTPAQVADDSWRPCQSFIFVSVRPRVHHVHDDYYQCRCRFESSSVRKHVRSNCPNNWGITIMQLLDSRCTAGFKGSLNPGHIKKML